MPPVARGMKLLELKRSMQTYAALIEGCQTPDALASRIKTIRLSVIPALDALAIDLGVIADQSSYSAAKRNLFKTASVVLNETSLDLEDILSSDKSPSEMATELKRLAFTVGNLPLNTDSRLNKETTT